MKIPAGKAALEKEWVKLESKKAWDLEHPREYDEVCADASRARKTVHFGWVYPLCHVKHCEFSSESWSYKGLTEDAPLHRRPPSVPLAN
jgi:hypothetical protein